MPTIPINTGPYRDHLHGYFRPNGPLKVHGVRPNFTKWSKAKTLAARFFVGFNVEGVPTWEVDDLVAVVHDTLVKLGDPPDATFYYTKGMWSGGGRPETEEGAQVLIIAGAGVKVKRFMAKMEKLGEAIREALKQWKVILEIQEDGVVVAHADISIVEG